MPPNATWWAYTGVRRHLHIYPPLTITYYSKFKTTLISGRKISDNLKWTTHINKICNRANSILGFIRRNLKHSDRNFKETAYVSLVRSVLDYASIVWDPYLKKDIDKIEGIQRRAARFVMNDYSRRSSVTEMMRQLKWTPLAERRRTQRLTFFFKIINDLVAVPATHYIFSRTGEANDTDIQNQSKLYHVQLTYIKTHLFQKPY